MRKIKTEELEGANLDRAVAKALGWVNYPNDSIERGSVWHCDLAKAPFGRILPVGCFNPSSDWSQGGPIIEREQIVYRHQPGGVFEARVMLGEIGLDRTSGPPKKGPTLLIAAMRAFVANKLGDEVEVST